MPVAFDRPFKDDSRFVDESRVELLLSEGIAKPRSATEELKVHNSRFNLREGSSCSFLVEPEPPAALKESVRVEPVICDQTVSPRRINRLNGFPLMVASPERTEQQDPRPVDRGSSEYIFMRKSIPKHLELNTSRSTLLRMGYFKKDLLECSSSSQLESYGVSGANSSFVHPFREVGLLELLMSNIFVSS